MADSEHVRILKLGRQAWNQWRAEHAEIRPDFVTATLCRGTFDGSDLSDADMTAIDMHNASLLGVDLCHALLLYATLHGSDMRSADLTGATLIRADLRIANLNSARFSDADLRGASLAGADLTDADLSTAIGLTRRQLLRSVINHNTRLPGYLWD